MRTRKEASKDSIMHFASAYKEDIFDGIGDKSRLPITGSYIALNGIDQYIEINVSNNTNRLTTANTPSVLLCLKINSLPTSDSVIAGLGSTAGQLIQVIIQSDGSLKIGDGTNYGYYPSPIINEWFFLRIEATTSSPYIKVYYNEILQIIQSGVHAALTYIQSGIVYIGYSNGVYGRLNISLYASFLSLPTEDEIQEVISLQDLGSTNACYVFETTEGEKSSIIVSQSSNNVYLLHTAANIINYSENCWQFSNENGLGKTLRNIYGVGYGISYAPNTNEINSNLLDWIPSVGFPIVGATTGDFIGVTEVLNDGEYNYIRISIIPGTTFDWARIALTLPFTYNAFSITDYHMQNYDWYIEYRSNMKFQRGTGSGGSYPAIGPNDTSEWVAQKFEFTTYPQNVLSIYCRSLSNSYNLTDPNSYLEFRRFWCVPKFGTAPLYKRDGELVIRMPFQYQGQVHYPMQVKEHCLYLNGVNQNISVVGGSTADANHYQIQLPNTLIIEHICMLPLSGKKYNLGSSGRNTVTSSNHNCVLRVTNSNIIELKAVKGYVSYDIAGISTLNPITDTIPNFFGTWCKIRAELNLTTLEGKIYVDMFDNKGYVEIPSIINDNTATWPPYDVINWGYLNAPCIGRSGPSAWASDYNSYHALFALYEGIVDGDSYSERPVIILPLTNNGKSYNLCVASDDYVIANEISNFNNYQFVYSNNHKGYNLNLDEGKIPASLTNYHLDVLGNELVESYTLGGKYLHEDLEFKINPHNAPEIFNATGSDSNDVQVLADYTGLISGNLGNKHNNIEL